MPTLHPDEQIMFVDYTHRLEDDTVTIGDEERQVFLSIPHQGFALLEWLREGATPTEVSARFESEYGEAPDLDSFLEALLAEGFIVTAEHTKKTGTEPARSTHFDWLTPRVAKLFINRPVLILCGLLVAGGVAAVIDNPSIMPGPEGLQFEQHFAALSWATFLIAISGVMLHEFAHVVAARAAGVKARIELSNRMYVPVVQTDMTGIWMADTRQRVAGFLSGPILDAASLGIITMVLWADGAGHIELSTIAIMLLEGVAFTYLARLIWQCLLFWRTDFYYGIATLFKCKNLMIDTENLLRNIIARLRRRSTRIDQSGVPTAEMRSVRVYTFIWVGGRVVALWAFASFTIPLLVFYVTQCVTYLTGINPGFGFLDFSSALLLGIGMNILGVILWARNSFRAWKKRRAA